MTHLASKRRGRKRANVAVTLPGSIFQKLRAVGIKDVAIAREIGVSQSTIQRGSSGLGRFLGG